ncbi:MAG: acetolactate synthase small subunit [Anaerolineaceae bacterium]|nr:acetolactate synthase small subunit [Anaerolineaceae bacterium]
MEEMDTKKLQTLAVLVDNESGVLSQVSRMFSRKGYNIESLVVGTTENPKISRITIDVLADEHHITLLGNQLRKLFPVHSVKRLTPETSIQRELMLIKVRTANGDQRNDIIQLANVFRAQIIDVSIETLTLAVIGDTDKISAIEKILKEFQILEIARTGGIALERGKATIHDETKERGEFNYGKNVL